MSDGLESIPSGLTIGKYDDWLIFIQRLEGMVRDGRARRIPPLWRALAQGEEWYLDTDSGEIYVYLSPDAPILPKWGKVDVFSGPEAPRRHEGGLSAIPTASMSRAEAESLKEILKFLVRHGVAEVVDPPHPVSTTSSKGAQRWYRDTRTRAVFRLVEDPGGESSRWESVPPGNS